MSHAQGESASPAVPVSPGALPDDKRVERLRLEVARLESELAVARIVAEQAEEERERHRRDQDSAGVVTANPEWHGEQQVASRRQIEEIQARLNEEVLGRQQDDEQIRRLEAELTRLREEGVLLLNVAQRTFYAGSAALYAQVSDFGRVASEVAVLRDELEVVRADREALRVNYEELRRRYDHAQSFIRKVAPRSLRKYMRKLIFGSAQVV